MPPKYRRHAFSFAFRCHAGLLPCSGWERVDPHRNQHQLFILIERNSLSTNTQNKPVSFRFRLGEGRRGNVLVWVSSGKMQIACKDILIFILIERNSLSTKILLNCKTLKAFCQYLFSCEARKKMVTRTGFEPMLTA